MAKSRAVRRTPPEQADDSKDTRDKSRAGGPFTIVGVGASAGGLEAFSALLTHLPLDTGMGFVLVQHLDPEHDSALTQLLGRATSLPVHEVTNNLRVEPNHVYVIPPNTNLGIGEGVLTLRPRPKGRTPHRSIDYFLEALAEDQHERAIGVILSGTATDGTVGLEAIKAEGGITFAQDDSARYDSMPRSAVAAGCVDFVLSPEAIATELARVAKHPAVARAPADEDAPPPSGGRGTPRAGAAAAGTGGALDTISATTGDGFKKILVLLRTHSGVDFSPYKVTTIQRRITRRMVLSKQNTLEDYAQFLRGNAPELDALYSDVLISVTSFFRNPDAFDVLQRSVLPTLLKQRTDDPLRVWVLGCSTGQEAYSIAMAFTEAADKAPRMRRLQVFATDLNDVLLDKARHGLYPKSLAQDLSPERLRRFFVEEEGGYRVCKPLREMVVFARQNIISDPAFSRMDIISCRNLLIYFEVGLQKKVFPVFHYALKAGGFLCLGASESIGGFTDLFETVDKKHKIYSKKAAPTPAFQLPAKMDRGAARTTGARPARGTRPLSSEEGGAIDGFGTELSALREADRVSISQFAPPAVLINAELQVLQFRGPTGAYLEPPTGKATFDVLKMARNGLRLPLRSAINRAKKDNTTARKDNVQVEHDGATRVLHLEVIPLKNLRERCFLIVFEDAAKATPATSTPPPVRGRRRATEPPRPAARSPRSSESRRLVELETDLAETRDYLQSILEQHEAANEELQASNEEVQSANEELQSINEELETSKEELESANEELTTLNEEMAHRNAELNRLNSDLINVQNSAHVAMVLLARDLTIRRFSAQAEKQFSLTAADVGRPIGHVRHPFEVTDLETFITDVIDTVRPREREVRDKDGGWFALRVRPYLTLDNKVDGAVLVLVDIDDLKRSEQASALAREYAENITATVREPLVVLDRDLRVTSVNGSYCETFRVTPAECAGRFIYDLGDRQWDIPELRTRLTEVLSDSHTLEDYLVESDAGHLGRRAMLLNARRMRSADPGTERILLAIEDITERRQAELALRESEAIRRLSQQAAGAGTWTWAKATDVISWSPECYELFGIDPHTPLRYQSWLNVLHPDDRERTDAAARHAMDRGEDLNVEYRIRHPERGERWLASIGGMMDPGNRPGFMTGISLDITGRRQAEQDRRAHSAQFETLLNGVPLGCYLVDEGFRIRHVNPNTFRVFGDIPDLIGRDFDDVIHILWPKPYADDIVRLFRHTLETGEPYMTPERTERRIDREVTESYEWQIHRIPMPEGGHGVVCYFRDISAQVRDQAALRQYADELSEADRHKNEFLAMLAHELRNPLAPILVSIELLRRARRREGDAARSLDLTLRVDHAVDVLHRQVGQMVRLVDDLLDAGRISRGKIDLRPERLELSSVVHHAVEAARAFSDRRGQELTVELPTAPVYVNADPTRLAQIVGNLLNNASKFTDRGGRIWLTVASAEESTPEDNDGTSPHVAPPVVIRVRDSGIGIAADRLEGIFEMFTQVDTSLERSLTGLGIGLTLVKTLAEMHGGTVEATSAGIGHGSEFVVRLPIVVETDAPDPQPTTTVPVATPLRILIVDDNHDGAESLALLLELNGHETHTAHDGLTAVQVAATLQPDVILLDIGLPGLNGHEVARRIRDQQRDHVRPLLVALTGWGQSEDRRRSKEAGFDAHLVKPVDHGVLAKILADFGAGNAGATPDR